MLTCDCIPNEEKFENIQSIWAALIIWNDENKNVIFILVTSIKNNLYYLY